MAALITADTCPACRQVHGPRETWGQPADWPTCPDHGHWLYVLRGPLATRDAKDGLWTYACHAPKCTYTHTQKEKATMTMTNEAAGAVLAIRDDQRFWDARQLAALTHLGVQDASQADLGVFFHRCQVTGLDPFANQICMIKRGGKWTIQTEIDGLRVIAKRAAEREGVDISYGPTRFKNAAGGWEEEPWIGDDPPLGAAVTVYKNGRPFHGSARYKSFVQLKDGRPVRQWETMPDLMIAKCAEAQALRKAFPHDLEAIVTSDEAHAAPAPQVTVQQVQAGPAPDFAGFQPDPRDIEPEEKQVRPIRPRRRGDVEGLRQDVSEHFDAIGVPSEGDERDNYLHTLANKEADLTERDLRFAIESLATCKDLEALVELCNPEPATS